MPIYEYACNKCMKIQELIQKVGEEGPLVCSHCGAAKSMSKLVSHSAFKLKGSGWYNDLYASAKSDNSQSETKLESSTKSESANNSPSETKSEAAKPKAEIKSEKPSPESKKSPKRT